MKKFTMILSIAIGILFLQGSFLSAYAEMSPDVKPGQVTNTVVWETSLKPLTGKDETLQIVCLKGTVNEDTYDKGKITSATEKFEFRLINTEGKIMSANNNLFDFDMDFYPNNFKIIFDDYNGDDYIDFAIGQSMSQPSGWMYKIYTIRNGEILELPVKNQPYIVTNEVDKQLDKNGAGSFKMVEHEGYPMKKCKIKTYQWDGKQFYVSDVKTQQLVSDKNKDAEITDMAYWPEYGISLYSINKPEKGKYKGYYLYVQGKENYYPDWESNYPAELHSISKSKGASIFTIHLINSSGTFYIEPTVITFNTETMSVIAPGPEYYYFNPPTNDKAGQMMFSGGALADDRNTDMLLMINGKLVSDINIIVYGDVYVPLYQINEKLGIALNQTKNDVPWQIFDGIAYVSLESVAKAISAEFGTVSEFESGRGINYPYDLVWIETQSKSTKPVYNQDTVVQYAKNKLSAAFEKYKLTALETYKDSDAAYVNSILNEIKTKIDGLKYVDSFSRFLVLDGVYRVLVDKYTGEIYFQQGSIARTWITKVDFSKPVSFVLGYFAG